jgi:hypothetical protein
MKTKQCLIFSFCITVILSLVLYSSLARSPEQIKSIVSQTQLHIMNINSKFNVLDQSDNKELDVESTYLELLGFVPQPRLYNPNEKMKITFATAFERFTENEKYLLESKLKYFPNDIIFIYDIDLSFHEQLEVKYFISPWLSKP